MEAPASPAAPASSRWGAEIKVYTRKYPRKNPKPPPEPAPAPSPAPAPTPTPEPNPNPLSETLSSTCRSIRRAEAGGAAARPDPVAAASILAPAPPDERAAASGDPSSGPNQGGRVPNGNGDDRAALAAEKADKARKRRVRSELRRRRPSPPPSPAPAFPGLLRGSYCRGRRGRRQAAAAAVQGGGHAQARRWRAPGVHRARLPRRRRGQSATPTEAPQPHRQGAWMVWQEKGFARYALLHCRHITLCRSGAKKCRYVQSAMYRLK